MSSSIFYNLAKHFPLFLLFVTDRMRCLKKVEGMQLCCTHGEAAHELFLRWDLLYFCLRLIFLYLALINRAGGLYGRILTEVVSTDRMQWGLYTRPRSRFSHTDRLSSVNKIFIIWQKQEQFNLFNLTGLY